MIKGLMRDKSRSRLPVIVVSIGVMLTVFMHAYINGFMGDTLEMNARFSYGHVKVMTRAYAEEMNQNPNDLALIGVEELREELAEMFPGMDWVARIQFGGLVDVPDENGETRSQGTVMGMGLDLLTDGTGELDRLGIGRSLVRGSLPKEAGQVLLSETFSRNLDIDPGETITLIGSSMNGSLVMANFTVIGTLSFGVEAMDRGTIIMDIEDARLALDMEDAAGEIIGFLPGGFYDDEQARRFARVFNAQYADDPDAFAPVMKSLSQQGSMGAYVKISEVWGLYVSGIFIFAMSLVLWNAGLLGGLRRYGEVGIRLAMGEDKGHVYRSMIYESIVIGFVGSVLGTAVGLFFAWLLQEYGIDISGMMEGASMMMPSVIRARITTPDFFIGFIPGVVSTVIGTMLAGIGIYKRQTAWLF
ncbi:MAG: FtsX-like permease family protein, partial [Bacteroidales bacterium]